MFLGVGVTYLPGCTCNSFPLHFFPSTSLFLYPFIVLSYRILLLTLLSLLHTLQCIPPSRQFSFTITPYIQTFFNDKINVVTGLYDAKVMFIEKMGRFFSVLLYLISLDFFT